METLVDEEAQLKKKLEESKNLLAQTMKEKTQVETSLKEKTQQEKNLNSQIVNETAHYENEKKLAAQQEKDRIAAEKKVKMLESVAKAKQIKMQEEE
jgi:hypothetical protein